MWVDDGARLDSRADAALIASGTGVLATALPTTRTAVVEARVSDRQYHGTTYFRTNTRTNSCSNDAANHKATHLAALRVTYLVPNLCAHRRTYPSPVLRWQPRLRLGVNVRPRVRSRFS